MAGVMVVIEIKKPSAAVPWWHTTEQGAQETDEIMEVFAVFGGEVTMEYEDVTENETVIRITYPSEELYETIKDICLSTVPTFIQDRDAYYESVGGEVIQTLVHL